MHQIIYVNRVIKRFNFAQRAQGQAIIVYLASLHIHYKKNRLVIHANLCVTMELIRVIVFAKNAIILAKPVVDLVQIIASHAYKN